MTQPFDVDPQEKDSLLLEAVSSRLPLQLSCLLPNGWEIMKSRFLATESESEHILLDYPTPADYPCPGLEPEQNIGVSFRLGHRKYVFTTSVTGALEQRKSRGKTRWALRIRWPETMQELQRRLYYRAPVPDRIHIPVDIWDQPAMTDQALPSGMTRGRMLDLSAGGVGLSLADEAAQNWRENEHLVCRFSPQPGGVPLEIKARFRHRESLGPGRSRVGLQFVGLETSPDGKATLQRLNEMTRRLRIA